MRHARPVRRNRVEQSEPRAARLYPTLGVQVARAVSWQRTLHNAGAPLVRRLPSTTALRMAARSLGRSLRGGVKAGPWPRARGHGLTRFDFNSGRPNGTRRRSQGNEAIKMVMGVCERRCTLPLGGGDRPAAPSRWGTVAVYGRAAARERAGLWAGRRNRGRGPARRPATGPAWWTWISDWLGWRSANPCGTGALTLGLRERISGTRSTRRRGRSQMGGWPREVGSPTLSIQTPAAIPTGVGRGWMEPLRAPVT